MAEITIDKTLLATTDPVMIKGGIPLHRDFPTANWGFGFGHTFWDKTVHTHVTTLATRAAVTVEGGILGPNYGARMEVEGTLDNATPPEIELAVTLDEFEAGMVIGFLVTAELQLEWKTRWVYWTHRKWHLPKPHVGWKDQINKTIRKEIDILPQLITLVKYFGELIPGLKKILKFLPANALDGMRDTQTGIMGGGGALTLHPHMTGKIDLITLAETLAKTGAEVVQPELIPLIELESEFEDVSKKVRPHVTTGPIFALDFPVEIAISKLRAWDSVENEVDFTDLDFASGNIVGSAAAYADSEVSKVGVHLTHSTGVDLRYGYSVSLTWFKILSLGKTKTQDLFSELGLDTNQFATHYTYELANQEGSMAVPEVSFNFISQE